MTRDTYIFVHHTIMKRNLFHFQVTIIPSYGYMIPFFSGSSKGQLYAKYNRILSLKLITFLVVKIQK